MFCHCRDQGNIKIQMEFLSKWDPEYTLLKSDFFLDYLMKTRNQTRQNRDERFVKKILMRLEMSIV